MRICRCVFHVASIPCLFHIHVFFINVLLGCSHLTSVHACVNTNHIMLVKVLICPGRVHFPKFKKVIWTRFVFAGNVSISLQRSLSILGNQSLSCVFMLFWKGVGSNGEGLKPALLVVALLSGQDRCGHLAGQQPVYRYAN